MGTEAGGGKRVVFRRREYFPPNALDGEIGTSQATAGTTEDSGVRRD